MYLIKVRKKMIKVYVMLVIMAGVQFAHISFCVPTACATQCVTYQLSKEKEP